jgi:diguanylate cyclase (GGDEF)-like protein/PAS domain S-box-containing protein
MRRFSLQGYLFLCLALLAVVPALLLGGIQTERWGAQQVARVERETQLAAELLARETGQLMAMHVREVESLARQVEALDSPDAAKLQVILAAQRSSSDGLSLMYVGDRQGIAVAVDPPLNADGQVAAGTDYSDRDYYREVMRSGRTTISRAQLGTTTQRPNVQIAAAIWDGHSTTPAAFAEGTLELRDVQVLAEQIAAKHPGLKMVVLDAEGRVLAHPDAGLRASMASLPDVALFQPAPDQAIRVAEDETGTTYRAAEASVAEHGLGWRVVVGTPEAEVQAFTRAAQDQTLAFAAASLALSLLLAGFLAALIARPVAALTSIADTVGHGDLSQPLPRLRWWYPREVHTQLLAVGRVIQRLGARTQELEQEVAVRTAELVASNRELQAAQQRYQSLFAKNPDAVFALDLEGRVQSINAAVEQVSGYGADLLLGRRFGEVFNVGASEDETSWRLEQVLSGKPQGYETTITHREGHTVDLSVTTLPIVVDGSIVGAYGIAKDVSERKQAEQALARSEERFRALVQNGGELLSIVDVDETIRYVSPSAEALLGSSPEEAVGTRLGDYVHPDDRPLLRQLLERAADSPRTNLTEGFRLRRPTGGWRHVEAVCRNLQNVPTIGGIVLNVRDVSERKVLEDELAYRAYHDALTDLPNRTLLVDRLRQALARGARTQRGTAVLFIDLDDFKVVNDSLGHALGDQLLVATAQRLRASVRPGDTVARLGGDEFIVLLEDVAEADDANAAARRMLAELEAPFKLADRELFVGASIGIALSGPDPKLPDDLLRDADAAMYAAKARGKGHYELFEPGMHTQPLERLALEAELRRVLERDELRLHYQPVVELDTGRVCGAEALLRWQHPRRGLVPPGQFIPLAEETGVIVPIGRWVLQEACREARLLRDRHPGARPFVMSVNISGRQFQHPGLVQDVAEALRAADLPACALRLEITESVAMEAGTATIETLQALKGLGVQLAIDDFGTGYSSLAYLKRFPVDTLKIDRSFVDGLGHDPQDTAIVRSVITIAKTLNLVVTGEGIETVEQLEELRTLECTEAQGFYFARPAASEALSRLIDAGPLAPDELARAA